MKHPGRIGEAACFGVGCFAKTWDDEQLRPAPHVGPVDAAGKLQGEVDAARSCEQQPCDSRGQLPARGLKRKAEGDAQRHMDSQASAARWQQSQQLQSQQLQLGQQQRQQSGSQEDAEQQQDVVQREARCALACSFHITGSHGLASTAYE